MKVDVAIIGAGTAGLTARRAALKEGASVVMIESGPYGTTCARVGCMPSKLLISAADAAHEARHAGRFGVHAEVNVDGIEVMARVQRERDRFAGFVVEAVDEIPAEQKRRGHAKFMSDTVLMVNGEEIHAKAVVIATGSTPFIPKQLAGHGERMLTNETVFELETLPQSMVVFGSGVIGLELGQAFSRLGVDVVILDPAAGFAFVGDPEVRASIKDVLGAELKLHVNANIQKVEAVETGIFVKWAHEDGTAYEQTFVYGLNATGRRPNFDGLGLENTSAKLDERGMPSFDTRTMQIEDLPIFIAGDANNDKPLLHEAADEGTIAGRNAGTYPRVRADMRRAELAVVFTDPQIAVVGNGFRGFNPENHEAGTVSFANQGRARVIGKNAGVVRVYATRRCGFLSGAEMFGPRMENMAHLLAWAVQHRMTVKESLEMPFYHPVLEEGLRTGLRDLAHHLKISEIPCDGDNMRNGPGT